ncbi:MAG TPA: phosphate ABC transporter permease PstA [Marmoricola sp.]|nr:phosphate ABC transporter permease PstA [Nocardioidaceae bacterium]MCB8993540.1 phosphate ABC transporter permease PstA [Nocardioidaceae bacterium]MCO5323341.1 phosphate ABC transporter permease PstA [Nocardioidaceae bacterium]HRV68487.1 phosphate ABC transporter permease PstA [Marmoricola sp.]
MSQANATTPSNSLHRSRWSRRSITDQVVTMLIWLALVIALTPLALLLWNVIVQGASQMNLRFLTWSMRNVVGETGGIAHAIWGTVLITFAATVIAVPIGLMTSIYLVEYAGSNRLGHWIRFMVDVMTGIPSIVAGLFAFALFALFFGPSVRMGFGGAVALSILMIPIVVRSSEEMLKLVPNDLREAAYALGVSKWRTITKVVLPTATSGIITGVTLAIARIIGETAPLLIIAGFSDSVNTNLFSDRMMTLPVFIYYNITKTSPDAELLADMAWGAAFVLTVIVLTLNLIARLAGRWLAPKRG